MRVMILKRMVLELTQTRKRLTHFTFETNLCDEASCGLVGFSLVL